MAPDAAIGARAVIGPGVCVESSRFVGPGAWPGAGSIVEAGAVVDANARLGASAVVQARASVASGVSVQPSAPARSPAEVARDVRRPVARRPAAAPPSSHVRAGSELAVGSPGVRSLRTPAPGVCRKTTVVCPEPLQAYDRARAQTVPANRGPVPFTR